MIAALLLTAACVAFSVTFRIGDPDLWQHLAVGRAIWQLHHVPTVNLWAWPVYGTPDVCPSWLFRALLWPFWSASGLAGLYAWRWITTLGAFALLWLTARRMGARGFAALFVLALAALSWRHRSQVRPETLVGVLFALELWILESWRQGIEGAVPSLPGSFALDRRVALLPLLWIWVNAHLSWPLGLAVLGAYGADAVRVANRAGRSRARTAVEFLAIALAGAVLALANPSGWRAVVQPFEFFLGQRNDPLYASIGELSPIMWKVHWRTGLPLLVAGWPLLLLWRARARRLDLAETLLCALLLGLALSSQRFAGFYALAAAPFMGRDLTDWLARFARAVEAPASHGTTRAAPAAAAPRSPWRGFATFAGLTLALSALEWSRPDLPPGVGLDWRDYPVGACDFIAAKRLRGPFFNEYYNAGTLLWRFWPDRTRLPFMDVHQSGTPEDRRLYPYVFASEEAWRALDRRRHFEVLLVDGALAAVRGDRLPDMLDADSTWALVFRDDNACLYVRREGRYRELAAREGYFVVPGGADQLEVMGEACARDPRVRAAAYRELLRQIASSPFNARASSVLANLDWMEGRTDLAAARLNHALALDPRVVTAHERLGMIALRAGDAARARREFDAEAKLGLGGGELDLHRGEAFEALGQRAEAVRAYRRQLEQRPEDADARAALERLRRSSTP